MLAHTGGGFFLHSDYSNFHVFELLEAALNNLGEIRTR
jgi:hypothetical protein